MVKSTPPKKQANRIKSDLLLEADIEGGEGKGKGLLIFITSLVDPPKFIELCVDN